jgi:hypothetical protein
MGHLPRRIMADRGSELHMAKGLMEKYRQPRDAGKPLVLRSPTGTPILLVEAMNAQYQRRMQTFRTSLLTNDPAAILRDISDQLNAQPRPARGNLTPLQLLALSAAQRQMVNDFYEADDSTPAVALKGLKPVPVGGYVRALEMTRKEQVANSKKGFAPKWTEGIFRVVRRQRIRNSEHFRYFLDRPGPIRGQKSYYRHEILHIPGPEPDRTTGPSQIDPASYDVVEASTGPSAPGQNQKKKNPFLAADAEWVPGSD